MADLADEIREMAERGLELWGSPSVALGITYRGETVFSGAFGRRDAERCLPADARTLYPIASCTKAFTAALVAQLVDEGALAWDTPVREYLPELRFFDDRTTAEVSVRDLLCHRTGLPRHELSWYGTGFTRRQIVESLRYLEPNRPLRTTFQYNNQCYVLAGVLLERVSGTIYEGLLRERVLEPLGMGRTCLYLDDLLDDPDHAVGYGRPAGASGPSGCVRVPYHQSPVEDRSAGVGAPYGPAGSVCSCVEDLLAWVRLHLADASAPEGVLTPAALAELHAPQMILSRPMGLPVPERSFTCYGLGWFVESWRGHALVEHGGNIDGFSSYVGLVPELDLGVVALTNMNESQLHTALAHEVIDRFLGVKGGNWVARHHDHALRAAERDAEWVESLTDERARGAAASHELAAYAGTYARPGYEPARVTLAEGGLRLRLNGWEVPLEHFGYDTFTAAGALGELPAGLPAHFRLAERDGSVAGLALPLNTEPGTDLVRFRRV